MINAKFGGESGGRKEHGSASKGFDSSIRTEDDKKMSAIEEKDKTESIKEVAREVINIINQIQAAAVDFTDEWWEENKGRMKMGFLRYEVPVMRVDSKLYINGGTQMGKKYGAPVIEMLDDESIKILLQGSGNVPDNAFIISSDLEISKLGHDRKEGENGIQGFIPTRLYLNEQQTPLLELDKDMTKILTILRDLV